MYETQVKTIYNISKSYIYMSTYSYNSDPGVNRSTDLMFSAPLLRVVKSPYQSYKNTQTFIKYILT